MLLLGGARLGKAQIGFAGFGVFCGCRVGIAANGTWPFSVAGD
jgi:hypothetical protein